ncbi:MAG TPA: GntG family PLP-dependent aldolase [Acidobacteriota bacterium]|jgi:threonine aldolase|nr:GntG family PLP-dependent aldolase [Acidobacteriota bacterium]HNT17289.1 GntG family PLP-dependent aldolase [Acidobacteriota bacterium]HPA26352.1 GntG family PLP-dependent aldolase [Acidobacteriota bacterium]HQO19752.1 GntG family PLP-dependent aldolase [Acidobacteriota bacterium]HQQ46334.1 GntG family PLP-dependent aldolase [Acidobacteriota bacterium]
MAERIIDLRSDTVTKPTPRMREAMARAEVGDDVYGEDPTVNLLQEKAAKLMGKERAIFLPSGTMGNQVAIKCHTQPGDEVIVEASSHIFNYELGAMSAISGVLPRSVPGRDGMMEASQVREAVRPDIYYLSRTTLLCLENTHNMAGGRCMPVGLSRELCSAARGLGLKCHLDGARIFNAAAALDVEAREIAEPFDSVMFCLSKGLSAPVGSLLAGSEELIVLARRFRKMLGGGMRQAGILAAAGLVALEDVVPLLADDHRRARELAEAAAQNDRLEADPDKVDTNIFMVRVNPPLDARGFALGLREKGVLVSPISDSVARFVTHREISDEDVGRVSSILKSYS